MAYSPAYTRQCGVSGPKTPEKSEGDYPACLGKYIVVLYFTKGGKTLMIRLWSKAETEEGVWGLPTYSTYIKELTTLKSIFGILEIENMYIPNREYHNSVFLEMRQYTLVPQGGTSRLTKIEIKGCIVHSKTSLNG